MKNIYILAFAALLFCPKANAQNIANSGFENWSNTTLYEDPSGYSMTTNAWVYSGLGQGNVTKVSGYHGSYGAKLTTYASQNDTMFAGLIIGSPGNGGIAGGLPFTGTPDSISAYVKYSIQPNDTAFFVVMFKQNGIPLGMVVKTFTGTQTNYARFSIPTNLFTTPDSIVAIISSSRLDSPRMPGSTMTIDSITMIGSNQQLPNPDFETWTPISLEEPDDWFTVNFFSMQPGPYSATKSTSSYAGTYALRLETVQTTFGDTMGFITNGYLGNNGPEGGMAVNANPMTVSGYYKYFPVGPDTALAGITTYRNGEKVDSVIINLNASSNYLPFSMTLGENSYPYVDTANIAFASSNIREEDNYIGLGSVLYIDALTITYFPTGVEENMLAEAKVYPNPFRDYAEIIFNNINRTCNLTLYDVTGKIIMNKGNISSGKVRISKEDLSPGIYFFRIVDDKGNPIAQGRLVKE